MDSGDGSSERPSTDTSQIRTWRSIVTLIVFVFANIVVLFPFHISVYLPRSLSHAIVDALAALRVVAPRRRHDRGDNAPASRWVHLALPMNFVTAPLIADLFLLAIQAIGRSEVHDGTVGANNISPLDIMAFFLSLAYIAISIDASGLIRYLAFKVLQWGGKVGHRLFFYLYVFFFALTAFIGNDPVILSGTAFLAYMTRVSSNIVHPRAWIYTQFSVANIGSAILVSSNPTNLVLAGAFDIKFINYTANIIVPVVATAVVLFPFLLYIVFADESLIPVSIKMHELPEEVRNKKPVNPNIPNARANLAEQESKHTDDETGQFLSLEEIMNPFLDKSGAAFGGVIMAATLITLLAVNASSPKSGEHPVFWITLPAAVVMICWDLAFGWYHRAETRTIARQASEKLQLTLVENNSEREKDQEHDDSDQVEPDSIAVSEPGMKQTPSQDAPSQGPSAKNMEPVVEQGKTNYPSSPTTLVSLIEHAWGWARVTFPTSATVLTHLPLALVPFALCMFVLVQALVSKGWVQVFAYGWDHWVTKTGTVGAVGGMGFLSVVLCNFAGTNIGTSILLSRVIQAWQAIHDDPTVPQISNRTFWATVYSMALGVNFGAFSAAFSASLAGLLWRDILARKHIRVSRLDFARVNLPIIAIAMTVGCVVLIGQVYIIRDNSPYLKRSADGI
ncbi:putative arsenite transmembrane transporter protein [Lentithecium fluviatile CBS 122367]|uniref:Putative arsenite transmembrane transporter protein n=1 Tax=Lentithecium fluviatile CBS 122367 TaxID=1168545 RepID=A0A6G1JGX5_9PLEO|nr:putative arsenite transmembrane transporter protein [Lentithecium fluviatile CBS 122367]